MITKNMKIKILSTQHLHIVLDTLYSQGYKWKGGEPLYMSEVAFIYTYSCTKLITYGSEENGFITKPHVEVTLCQKPIEYFFEGVKKYEMSLEEGVLHINGKQVDMDKFTKWIEESCE